MVLVFGILAFGYGYLFGYGFFSSSLSTCSLHVTLYSIQYL